MREERQNKHKRARNVMTNEDYPEVEYKDDNGDTVSTEREWSMGRWITDASELSAQLLVVCGYEFIVVMRELYGWERRRKRRLGCSHWYALIKGIFFSP